MNLRNEDAVSEREGDPAGSQLSFRADPTGPERATKEKGFRLASLVPQNNETISLIVLIGVVLLFTVTTDGLLLTRPTLNILATFAPEILIITIAVGLVLVTGQIDLSVGSMYVATSVILGTAVQDLAVPVWVSALIALGAGTLMGLINGILVTATGISSFIVTLGTMWAFSGLMLIALGSGTVSVIGIDGVEGTFNIIAGKALGVSRQLIWLAVIAGALALVMARTRFGVRLRAFGSNEQSARMMGLPTRQISVKVFALSGFLCGIAGVIQVAQSGQAVPNSGDSVMLTALAGAIIGGIALTGGRGGVFGPLLGGATLQVISIGFVMMGVVEFWTNVLVAVAVIFTAWAFRQLELLRVRKARP